jgi:hypothetical protein
MDAFAAGVETDVVASASLRDRLAEREYVCIAAGAVSGVSYLNLQGVGDVRRRCCAGGWSARVCRHEDKFVVCVEQRVFVCACALAACQYVLACAVALVYLEWDRGKCSRLHGIET